MMAILMGVGRQLIAALICISLIVILSVLSLASWPSVCLFQRNVSLGLLPIFCVVYFFDEIMDTKGEKTGWNELGHWD